jgi:hypothetical protein
VIKRLRSFAAENERGVAAAFFAGGFGVDLVTLGRIDSGLMIAQQAAYLAVITAVLTHMLLEPAGATFRYARQRTALVHFLLGALLSLYTLFFFKSASLLVSFAFLGVLVALLLANETRRFKALGLHFKFGLLALCHLCFFAAVVPMVVGSLGVGVFLLSLLVGCVPLVAIAAWLRFAPPTKQIVLPLGTVLLGFLVFYFFRLIPPVPLSIPFIGVYHGVERTAEGYQLSHERAGWRFWHNGDQRFRAQPGDRVYVFFRVFSPARFSDQVLLRWYWRERGKGWVLQDTIPIRIVGGREEGFRGYGVKAKYQPGAWKVQVETMDGREIGRVYFDVETIPEAPRHFRLDAA